MKLSAILLTTLLAAAPAVFAQIPGNTAWVRVVHAASDAPAVDVTANGTLLFQGIKFKQFTEYTPVTPGTYTLGINVSGTSTTALTGGPYTISGGTAYTFYAMGTLGAGTLQLMGTGDDVNAPGAARTRIRVVHAASTAPAVDVYATAPFAPLTGAPALASVPFPLASGYLTVPAGAYQARVTVAGTKTVAIDSGRVPFEGNTVRTVVAIDPAMPGGPFELLVLPDVN